MDEITEASRWPQVSQRSRTEVAGKHSARSGALSKEPLHLTEAERVHAGALDSDSAVVNGAVWLNSSSSSSALDFLIRTTEPPKHLLRLALR